MRKLIEIKVLELYRKYKDTGIITLKVTDMSDTRMFPDKVLLQFYENLVRFDADQEFKKYLNKG